MTTPVERARDVDIVDILEKLEIPHKRESGHVKIECPFTGERTPSFAVYSDHVFCYSCQYHNDGIGFLMDMLKVSFMDAVKMLNNI